MSPQRRDQASSSWGRVFFGTEFLHGALLGIHKLIYMVDCPQHISCDEEWSRWTESSSRSQSQRPLREELAREGFTEEVYDLSHAGGEGWEQRGKNTAWAGLDVGRHESV